MMDIDNDTKELGQRQHEKGRTMQPRIRIEDLKESNVDDVLLVCSSSKLNDPVHVKGMELKRRWLRHMLQNCGPVAKIAYCNEKPVAQILYYPEKKDPTSLQRREGVLAISCIYNPVPTAQKLGIGTKLLQSVLRDAKGERTCLGKKPCKFIVAKAFDTGESLSMPKFFKKNGFLPSPEERNMLYFPVEGNYEQVTIGAYSPLPEDKGKAIILYSPSCQFSYQFAMKMKELIQQVEPSIPIEVINEWEKPEESVKRKNWPLILNAVPIRTFFMNTELFKEELRQAMGKNP